eukprot:EG_transcript_14452
MQLLVFLVILGAVVHSRALPNDTKSMYPQNTVAGNFTTAAVKEEIRKHDRLVVQATAFMSSLDAEKLRRWKPLPRTTPFPLLLQVMVVNRAIPYIYVLLMMLMVGHEPEKFLKFTKVNIFYIERRPEHIQNPELLASLRRIPFVSLHDWSTVKHPGMEDFGWEKKYFMNLFSDYMGALKVFLASGSRWCVMLEEDAVTPVNFLDLLQRFVLLPLNASDNNMSSVALYVNYNGRHSHACLEGWNYAGKHYDADRAKLNVELRAAGQPPYQPRYTLRRVSYFGGAVAQLFSRLSASKFLKYLRTRNLRKSRALDLMLNADKYFPKYTGIPRLQVEPSLVNHIGFYVSRAKQNIPHFGELRTDVRFQLDPGP